MQMINPEQEPESALLDQLQGFRDGRYERISGAELARRLTRQRPDIRILLMRRQRKGPKPDEVEATSLVENPGSAVIDDALKRKSPGNYALGYLDGDTFSVFYVGRSDSDVRRGLCSWVGKPAPYGRFWSPTKTAWKMHRGGRLRTESPALDHVGNDGNGYTRFAYSYADSAEDAYAKEWRNYDSFGGRHGLDNDVQPILAVG